MGVGSSRAGLWGKKKKERERRKEKSTAWLAAKIIAEYATKLPVKAAAAARLATKRENTKKNKKNKSENQTDLAQAQKSSPCVKFKITLSFLK